MSEEKLKADVRRIVERHYEDMFMAFDNLGVREEAILDTLNSLGEPGLCEAYDDWIREGAEAPEDDGTPQTQAEVTEGAVSAEEARLKREEEEWKP